MIYKYTKCESVIAKIMADANLNEGARITDIREWIFEAIEKIGAPMLYIERESGVDGCPIFKIEDYQIPIPDDLNSLTSVAYSNCNNGGWIPCRVNNSNFKQTINKFNKYNNASHCHEHINHMNDYDIHEHCPYAEGIHEHHLPMKYKPITHRSLLYGENLVRHTELYFENRYEDEPTFFIKPGWIVLNKRNGFVKLQYKAIATDERGYPLIPDIASYQEAVYWYVMMKISFPKYLKGKLGGKGVNSAANVYTYIQLQWNFYRNLAYAEAMMPTESDMIGIKNEWNKLIPDWDSDEVFFKPEGSKQLNYTDYYYGY